MQVPDLPEPSPDSPKWAFHEEVVLAIDRALDDQGMVVVRETDLEAIPQYLATMRQATLTVIFDDLSGTFSVDVGKLKSGEFLLPWRSDSITEELTNGKTFLELEGEKFFFSAVRELFYGDTKAFVACTPSGHE
jgi:hypothetical protein